MTNTPKPYLYTTHFRTDEFNLPYMWRLLVNQGPLGQMRLDREHPKCKCPHRDTADQHPEFNLHNRNGTIDPYWRYRSPETCETCPMRRNTSQDFVDEWERTPVKLHLEDFSGCFEPGSKEALVSSQKIGRWFFQQVSKAMTLSTFDSGTSETGVHVDLLFPILKQIINSTCIDETPIRDVARKEGIHYGVALSKQIWVPHDAKDEELEKVTLSLHDSNHGPRWNDVSVPFFVGDLRLTQRYNSIYGHPVRGPYLVFYLIDQKRRSNRLFSLPVAENEDMLLVVESNVEREFAYWLHDYRGSPWTYKPMSLANFEEIPGDAGEIGRLAQSGWKPKYRFDFLLGWPGRPMIVEVAGFSDKDYLDTMEEKAAYWKGFSLDFGFAVARRKMEATSLEDAFEFEVRS